VVNGVSDAYSLRAAEYVELFGSMDAVHPEDRQFVETWARGIEVVDSHVRRLPDERPQAAIVVRC
jgi:hypothetical protein